MAQSSVHGAVMIGSLLLLLAAAAATRPAMMVAAGDGTATATAVGISSSRPPAISSQPISKPPLLLGNCTCSRASRLRYLGECFVALPARGSKQQVVLAFHTTSGVLLEARSTDRGTHWEGWRDVPAAGTWIGSSPRCAVTGTPSGVTRLLICTISHYPTAVLARSALWNGSSLHWNNDSQVIWRGKNGGGIRHTIKLRSGRVLCMVQTQIGARDGFPSSVITLWSDPPYATWHHSQPVGCAATPGTCVGAVEPVAVEHSDGSLMAMMRTQTGVLWQTNSTDGGATLAEATPTRLASSDSPPFLLRLRHNERMRGRNGSAILLLWVNVRTSAPLTCVHDRAFSGGVYSVRHILHGAISLDDGRTWHGHREVYRDPLMKAEPPRSGDIGVAYSYGVELIDGSVLFATGQGVGRSQLIRLDPTWLIGPQDKAADFSSRLALTTWNAATAIASPDYVSTCMYFRRLPAKATDPNCSRGHDGTHLQNLTVVHGEETASTQALCMTLTNTAEMATALWNFPSHSEGSVSITLVQPAHRPTVMNATWALADAAMPPWDTREQSSSVFSGSVPPILPLGISQLLLRYSVTSGKCTVRLNNKVVAVATVKRRVNEGVVSYLALRSLGPSSTLCVQSLTSTYA